MSSLSIPIVNLSDLYVDNLQLSVGTNTLLNVAAGQARDSTNTYDIVSNTVLQLNTAAKGAGGLDTGTLTASTLYAVFLIFDPTLNVPVNVLFSLSANNPVMPATRGTTYGAFRRIGWILIDASSNIANFYMAGSGKERIVNYNLSITDSIVLSAGASTTFAPIVEMVGFVPTTASLVTFTYQFNNNLAGATAGFRASNSTVTELTTTNFVDGASAATSSVSGQFQLPAIAQTVDYYVQTASDSMNVYVSGYVDFL
jgi:hypothetical protein